MNNTWTTFGEWEKLAAAHELQGTDAEGRDDLAASVLRTDTGWIVTWWPGPYTHSFRQSMIIEGTFEEAKAVAYAQVKM